MKTERLCFCAVAIALMLLLGCDTDESPLAPYEGQRPLILQAVTLSSNPDVQWVGGRVAAVGVNRGAQAALDSTLVWIMTADQNEIQSALRIGPGSDADLIVSLGGTPTDSLATATEYTFWLADESALSAGLPVDELDEFAFADTSVTLNYVLRGRFGGDASFVNSIRVVRNQSLTEDLYRVEWAPADANVRRLAIREGSSGGFTDLVWDVLADENNAAGITTPVTIGEAPEGSAEAVEWPDAGFAPKTHTLWMAADNWSGIFSPRAPGYVFYQIFSSNFE
jgi:hypothetical protein